MRVPRGKRRRAIGPMIHYLIATALAFADFMMYIILRPIWATIGNTTGNLANTIPNGGGSQVLNFIPQLTNQFDATFVIIMAIDVIYVGIVAWAYHSDTGQVTYPTGYG